MFRLLGFLCAALAVVLLSHGFAVQAEEHDHHSYFGSHGMVLTQSPKGQWLASHMPLYVAPHDYQIIYTVEISDERLAGLAGAPLIRLVPPRATTQSGGSAGALSVMV